MLRTAILILLISPLPTAAQTCFDPAQCARDAIMTSRAASREVSSLAAELRTLRADRRALAADVAALREDIATLRQGYAEQQDRIDAVEQQNAILREALGLAPAEEDTGK